MVRYVILPAQARVHPKAVSVRRAKALLKAAGITDNFDSYIFQTKREAESAAEAFLQPDIPLVPVVPPVEPAIDRQDVFRGEYPELELEEDEPEPPGDITIYHIAYHNTKDTPEIKIDYYSEDYEYMEQVVEAIYRKLGISVDIQEEKIPAFDSNEYENGVKFNDYDELYLVEDRTFRFNKRSKNYLRDLQEYYDY